MVLDGASYDMIPLELIGESHTLYSKVICLSAAAGKYDFFILSTNKISHLNPCLLDSSFCLLPIGIDAGRVTKGISKIGQHRFRHLGMRRCGGSIIKVYPLHSLSLYNVSNDGVNSHPFGSHPGDALLDFSLFPLQL